MSELAEIVAGWPLAASLATAIGARGWLAGRRRRTINEALHELRRPLQAIVLAAESGGRESAVAGSAQLASAALERLDCEINGRTLGSARRVVAAQPLLESAVRRWKARATLGGGSLTLCWRAGEALVEADRLALGQAFDNLIVNAIEHGGPAVTVRARALPGRLRVAVADSARVSRPASRSETPAELIARLSGRRPRGHGLAVVKRTAAAHGGRFALHRSERGSVAVFELPLLGSPTEPAA